MGSDRHYPEEAPAHAVKVPAFWMDATAVTNAQFARFVEATGYVTLAERIANDPVGGSASDEPSKPGGRVFRRPAPGAAAGPAACWTRVPGASWRNPQGPDSSIIDKPEHPVVQIAYADAFSYARWTRKDLPTEAEWEFAARGGLEGAEYSWGNEFTPAGRHMANTWQGSYPWEDSGSDGFVATAPVRSFPPNGFGLYEMTGNVWEWTADWYKPYTPAPVAEIPAALTRQKVLKGGSYLTSPSANRRYRPAARASLRMDAAACDVGFRCVVRPWDPIAAQASASH